MVMQWTCRVCSFVSPKRGQLLKHYRLKHGSFTRTSPIPCLHQNCICTFKSFNALKVHLSKFHAQITTEQGDVQNYQCQACEFREPCSENDFFTHLRKHLKLFQKVQCPYKDCEFETTVYTTFNAHKSRNHDQKESTCSLPFKPGILEQLCDIAECSSVPDVDASSLEECTDVSVDINDIDSQLQHILASLFLKMQTILHMSESALKEIIQEMQQIFQLSGPLVYSVIQKILQRHYPNIEDAVVKEVAAAVTETNVFLKHTSAGGSLSTSNRRASFIAKEFSVVEPVEFITDKHGENIVYIPLLEMLQALLSRDDILSKALSPSSSKLGEYSSYRDGSHFRENAILEEDQFRIALALYIDDFEVANPLGTARKKHKLCAVYWVLANLDPKYRSFLHAVQLALLCRVNTVKAKGYPEIMAPLIKDLVTLEENGVYIEKLGASIKGTVLYVAADNLAAHSLAGFQESFIVERMCRVCMATGAEIQTTEVSSGVFTLRTKDSHDLQVQEVKQDPSRVKHCGVKSGCILRERLTHFHVVDGFPPDILHDFLEGVVPFELCLCIQHLIKKNYISLETLNQAIKEFPYSFSDKTDKPQQIPKALSSKKTIGGNGHENWCLIRLLPLMIGHHVPEGDETWDVLMALKDVLEMVVSVRFTDESLLYLESKVSEHRELLLNAFPNCRLRPKHHYIEHYPYLTKVFGPLIDMWTMRFEGKHKFFKKVIQQTQNFRNVPLTLARRHQKMMAYHLDCASFFKPALQANKVQSIMVSTLPVTIQEILHERLGVQNTVLSATSVVIDGINYASDMVVSVGSRGGLPMFRQIKKVLVLNMDILFLCKPMSAWYHEHLRAYELTQCCSDLVATQLSELNDVFPLSAYQVRGALFISLKRYILC